MNPMPISNPASMMQPSSKCGCGFLAIFRASIYKILVMGIRIPKSPIVQTGFSRKIRKNSNSDLVLSLIPYPIIGTPIKRELPIPPMAISRLFQRCGFNADSSICPFVLFSVSRAIYANTTHRNTPKINRCSG